MTHEGVEYREVVYPKVQPGMYHKDIHKISEIGNRKGKSWVWIND